jgi:hypothetical protein
MKATLYDLIGQANLMDIDDKSIRHFGLDVDGLEEEEGDDAICLHVEMTDESFDKWEWFFTIKELKNAKYDKEKKLWNVQYGSEDYPLEIRVYHVISIEPWGY